jgi:hypothetical protein
MEYLAACIIVFIFIGLPAVSIVYHFAVAIFMIIDGIKNTVLTPEQEEEFRKFRESVKAKA